MRIPKLAETRLYTKRLDSFGGIRRVGQVRDGEFSDAVNLTNDDYPYLKTRKYRLIMDKADEMTAAYPVNGIFEMPSFGSGYDGIGVVRGEHVFINGKQVLAGTNPFDLNSEDAQDIVMMGAYALFFPAKKYVNLSRLYSVPEGLRSDDYGNVTCPDMDIIMSSGNRLWGAKYGNVEREGAMVTVNEVYASKLGDFNTWTASSESSTSAGDPYTVSIGAPGYFTGACELNNKPVFFKEDYIISVYGTEPANFQVRTDEAEGVRLGCARTVSVSNGTAYYVGKHGVYVYGGGTPVLISEELGDSGDGMRQAQAERYSIFNGAGSGAVFNGKYYVNARLFPESFERFTFVYDIGRRSWQRAAHETDDTAEAINSFIVVSDYLLYTPEVDTVIPDPVTVSGSAVSFTGAAADWPLKDLTAAIVPVQSGSGDPYPPGGGKNKLNVTNVTRSYSGITYKDKNDYYWIHGTCTNTYNGTSVIGSVDTPINQELKSGVTYVFSCSVTGTSQWTSNNTFIVVRVGGVVTNYNTNTPFTLESDGTLLRVASTGYVNFLESASYDIKVYAQIEEANSATSFAPYSNIRPISGWTECKVTRTGKNLLNPAWLTESISTRRRWAWTDGVKLKGGETYTFSCSNGYGNITLYFVNMDGSYAVQGVKKATYTPQSDTLIKFQAYRNEGIDNAVTFQLELGSSATAYEPYRGDIYTVTFGSAGTVYGGTLDVTTGKLTVDKAIVDLGYTNLSWKASSQIGKFYCTNAPDYKPGADTEMMCSIYKFDGAVTASPYYGENGTIRCWARVTAAINRELYVVDDRFSDLASFVSAMSGVQLCYELATPIVYDLSPVEIRTLAGQNTIWADTGNVTVKYIPEFTVVNNVYGITNHQDAVPVAEEDEEQTDGVPFAAVTGRIGYETHDHKTLSRVTVRMRVGAGEGRKIRYSLNYDDEKDANEETVWRDVHEIAAAPIRTFTLSVRPRRCDHFQMKIEGRGDVEVYSVEYVYEYGSDLANHILN